jgi:ribosomal protein S21
MLRCTCLARRQPISLASFSTLAVSRARSGPPRQNFGVSSSDPDELRSEDGFYQPDQLLHYTEAFEPGKKYTAKKLDGFWHTHTNAQLRHTTHFVQCATPYTVRTVPVGQGNNLASAWSQLNTIMQQSGVRRELSRQQEYEKPTAYRHRVASERHRRRFKHAVGQSIATIMRMKKKGQ